MPKSKKAGVKKIQRKSKNKSKSSNNSNVVIAMCMKCKKKMNMLNAKQVVLKNGRNAMKGACECGTKMFKFI